MNVTINFEYPFSQRQVIVVIIDRYSSSDGFDDFLSSCYNSCVAVAISGGFLSDASKFCQHTELH
jgi:hypothetical protein